MSINMNNKYYEMHLEVLDLCAEHEIRIMPGKRAAYEILSGKDLPGLKDFLLLPEDMAKFMEVCVPELEKKSYIIAKEQLRSGKFCRVIRTDMLATTVPAVMNNPDGRHSPQFLIRELSLDNGEYCFTANGVTNAFESAVIDGLIQIDYMGSCVYVAANPKEHLKVVCGMDADRESVSLGYFLFSTEYSHEEFLSEARKRGYLSEESCSRFKEHREWKKKKRSLNDEAYNEYINIFLGLKQP